MSNLTPRDEHRPSIKTPQELVHIRHKITLLQYKYWVLMLRAYREAYEERGTDIAEGDYCYLPMSRLAEHLGYEPKTTEIEHDLEAIRKEPIIFNVLEKDGKKGKTGRGFISEWYVSSNRIGVIFPPMIRRAIENLDHRESIFHLLNWSIFNSFTGKYEAILYKLCKDYIGAGRTPYMSLEKFRDYMGIKATEYSDFKRLNQWVITGPIKRINESELSDIIIEQEFKREIRKVIGVWFRITAKKQTGMDFGDDPAFRFAKVSISIAQQKKYIEGKGGELVELSIQRANEYAEEQEKLGKVVVNLGALYRKAIDEDWGTEYASKKVRDSEKRASDKKKKAEERAIKTSDAEKEQVSSFNRFRVTEAVKAITIDEKRAYASDYITEVGSALATTWNVEKADFSKLAERVKFTTWLRQKVAPAFDEAVFLSWLKTKQATPTGAVGE
jgi:Initiator Replication protein